MNNYALWIKQLRVKMIITQTELAHEIGVSYETVNRWENGRQEPTIKYKRKLHILFDKYGITDD